MPKPLAATVFIYALMFSCAAHKVIFSKTTLLIYRKDIVASATSFIHHGNLYNADFMLRTTLPTFELNLTIDVVQKSRNLKFQLANAKANACKLLKTPSKNKFMASFFTEVKRSSNLECPLRKVCLKVLFFGQIRPLLIAELYIC